MKISLEKLSRLVLLMSWVFLLAAQAAAQQTKPEAGLHENTPNVHALTHARLVAAPGRVLEDATLVVRDGYIEAVGPQAAIPMDAVVHDLSGRTIYAGLIDLFSDYGMPKAKPQARGGGSAPKAAPKPAGPHHWNPAVKAEVSAAALFTADSKRAKGLRKAGFTAVLTFPRPGIFRGDAALVFLGDGDPGINVYAADVAQAMAFNKGFRGASRGLLAYPRSLMGAIALMRQTFLDAQWYAKAWAAYRASPAGQDAPEVNLALQALQPYARGAKPVIMEASDELSILRASRLAREFNLKMWVFEDGHAYRRIPQVKATGLRLIVPVAFPKPPEVASLEEETGVALEKLRHWDFAPENPARLARAGIEFALTAAKLKKTDDFLQNVRTAVASGLSAEQALSALTTTPAAWLEASKTLGTLDAGKVANFIVTDGDLFADGTKVLENWVAGKKYEVVRVPEVDVRGSYLLEITHAEKADTGAIEISGTLEKPAASLRLHGKKIKAGTLKVSGGRVTIAFPGDSIGVAGLTRLSGQLDEQQLSGRGVWGSGEKFLWTATLSRLFAEKGKAAGAAKKAKAGQPEMAEFQIVYPEGAFGRPTVPDQPEVILVKNATLWTSGPEGILENSDMLIRQGKIAKIGRDLKAPAGATVIDAAGKHVTAGLIDAHSHIAGSGGLNEGTHAISSEVRIGDVLDSDDINIYRQLAGGLTSSNVLHGSANPIGGQNAAIKLRWGAPPEALKFDAAMPSIKFALGENVKRSRSQNNTRYPNTRMGVEEFIRDQFYAAKDYREAWRAYERGRKKNKNLIPPRKNLRYEALLEILDGKRQIHCHSYRQDEILALIRVADEVGFKVEVFTHILEGYKVADDMLKHGSMVSSFSDWWAYKFEVYDAIPYNGALMHDVGLVVSYNSDSAELARRLNTEATKAVKYGGVSREEAIKFVTLNPAKQLHVENRVGSLEPGKDADFVVWSGSPLSTLSRCEQTWVDGRKYFDYEEDRQMQQEVAREKSILVQKILKSKKKQPASGGARKRPTTATISPLTSPELLH